MIHSILILDIAGFKGVRDSKTLKDVRVDASTCCFSCLGMIVRSETLEIGDGDLLAEDKLLSKELV